MSKIDTFSMLEGTRKVREELCDLCVIGAGAAGIYTATRLAANGRRVVLIDAGGSLCRDASAMGFETDFEGGRYGGATEGRMFGLGGTTSKWGGVLIPHSGNDLRHSSSRLEQPWSHIVQTVKESQEAVLDTLGYSGPDPFFFDVDQSKSGMYKALEAVGFEIKTHVYMPFGLKNFSFLLRGKSRDSSRIRIFTNAIAKGWEFSPADASATVIRQLTAVAHNGNELRIAAKHFVIAAGAIESTRLLLELNENAAFGILPKEAAVGCYLGDHLSTSIADVETPDVSRVIKAFSPYFANGWMRGYRFLKTKLPDDLVRAFLHFDFEIENPGFDLARKVLYGIQGKYWPKISAGEIVSGVRGVTALGFNRFVRRSLYVPSGTATHLQLDVEQVPNRTNSIRLGDRLDQCGRRVPVIRWAVHDEDYLNIERLASHLLERWKDSKDSLPRLKRGDLLLDGTKLHDAYHPVGTCRMGEDPEATVDTSLKVHGTTNLWIVSTAVLPTAGTANPTFTMLCLAETLAEHLNNSIA